MFLTQNSLSEIEEKISDYDNMIQFQKNEILKTTSLIDNFQDCLTLQNEALESFILDKERLQAEKSKCIESSKLVINDTTIESNDIKKVPPVKVQPKITNDDSKAKPRETENVMSLKRKLPNGDGICTKNKIICLSNPNAKMNIIEIEIPEVKKNTIHAIFVYGKDIYIGGTNGMLLRHTPEYTHIYETNTVEDIRQIAVLKQDNKLSINVFTKNLLIIYEDITWYTQRKEIDIPGIGDIFVDDDQSVYIPFSGGLIKRSENNVLKKSPSLNKLVRSFVPCYGKSRLALISFEDKMVNTTTKTELQGFRVVGGLNDVVGIRRIMNQYFVCYSTETLWLLNSAFQIIHKMRFDRDISFVECFDGLVVVIDASNNVQVHSLVKDRRLDARVLWREKVNGIVTSVSFVNSNVYLAVGNDIVIIKI